MDRTDIINLAISAIFFGMTIYFLLEYDLLEATISAVHGVALIWLNNTISKTKIK